MRETANVLMAQVNLKAQQVCEATSTRTSQYGHILPNDHAGYSSALCDCIGLGHTEQ